MLGIKKLGILILLLFSVFSTLCGQMLISDKIDLADSEQVHVLHTRRGDVLIGRIVSIKDTQLEFALRNDAGIIYYNFQELSFVGILGEKPTNNLQVSEKLNGQFPAEGGLQSLFYSSTAFGYEDRKGEYRNTMLAYNYVDWGLSENFTIGGGFLLPIAFNVRFKTNISLGDYVHFGLAANQFFFIEGTNDSPWGHLYGIASIGTKRLFINVTHGVGVNWAFDENYPLTSLGFSALISKNGRISAEVFIYPNDGFFDTSKVILPAITAERFGQKSKFQFGVTGIPDSEFPVFPLLAYARYF